MAQNSPNLPLTPPNPPIQIKEPTKEENRYRFSISVAGLEHSAYLTYELPRKSNDRNILMVNVPQPFISNDHKAEYERLIERVKESSGHFAGAKNIVNRLAENEFANLPNVRIAVHKFGPVPVYVLPEKYTVKHLGSNIDVQIGIYPNIRFQNGGRKNINLKLPFLATKAEFVRSLNVDLGLMFQRYLEDVGEGMYDIKHHLNLAGVFDRAMEIESVLAESLKSKLDVATPSLQVYKQPSTEDEKAISELFEKESDWIFTARYARQFALYFLNELYRHIGLDSRSQYYRDGFGKIQNQFDTLLGAGFAAEARKRINLMGMLSKAIRAYTYEDKEVGYDRLREINVDDEPLWIRRFVQFARFIGTLEWENKREKLAPTVGRLFISHHHDVPVTEVLKTQITNYIKTEFPNRVEVLSVRETDAGVKFKSPIRTRIWLSDTVSEIVPKETQVISGNKVKDYLWIAREAEYGLLLGKRVIYLVEKGINEERVRADLMKKGERSGLIPSTARVPDWLERRLIESFTEYTRGNFTVETVQGTAQDLDATMRKIIHGEAQKAIERRHRDILLGFHQQFPEWARRTLKHIQETVPYPIEATKKTLALKLRASYKDYYPSEKEAEKAITNVWELAKKRALMINGSSMPLMKLLKKRRYSGNLRQILMQLRPDLNKGDIEGWERQLLIAIVSETENASL